MIGLTISRPRPPSESSRCCWIGKARTDRSRCRRTWKRPSVTSRDSRTGSNSGPRRDTIESRPAKEVARDAGEYTSTYRYNRRRSAPSVSRPHTLKLHVAHAIPDFAEEDLLLHPMSESDRPADFRPRATMAFGDHVHEILRMVRLRVALVGAEMGAVLEAGLRDDAAAREILVRLQSEFEVGLNRLRLLDEPRESDRSLRPRAQGEASCGPPPPLPPARGVPPGRTPRVRSTPAPNICSASSSARHPADTPENRRGRRGLRRRSRGPSGPGTRGSESRTRSSKRSRPGTVPGRTPPCRAVATRAGLPRRGTPPPGDSIRGRLPIEGCRRTRGCRPHSLPRGRPRSRGRRAVPPPSGTAKAGTAIKGSPLFDEKPSRENASVEFI